MSHKRRIIHKTKETENVFFKDYLDFSVKSHVVTSAGLYKLFQNERNTENKKIYRGKIFFEYILALEELFAFAYAIHKVHMGRPSARKIIFSYGNIDVLNFVKGYQAKQFNVIFSFPDVNKIPYNLTVTPQDLKKIYDTLKKILVDCKKEYLQMYPLFNKLKHCFLVKKNGPNVPDEYKGDELNIMTVSNRKKYQIVVQPIKSDTASITSELKNISLIENTIINLVRLFLAGYPENNFSLRVTKSPK